MPLNLCWEILHQAFSDIWRSGSEATRTGRLHGIADVADFIPPLRQIVRSCFASEPFGEPLRADTAGEALATRFLSEKFHRAMCHFDYVPAIIEHNNSSGTEHGSYLPDTRLIERYVQVFSSEETAG